MNDKDALELLYEHARSLEKAVGDIERDMKTWLPRMDHAADPERTIAFLQSRYERQLLHTFEMGKVAARIEELEARVNDRDEREQIQSITADWRPDEPAEEEDRLAWLGLEDEHPKSPSEDGVWQEPEHERR